MPKRSKAAGSAAVQPSKGKKTVFGDDEASDIDFQISNDDVEVMNDEHEDSDDDGAPETVEMGAGRAAEESKQQKAQSAELAKRQAARIRLQKVQALKDAHDKLKGKGKAVLQQPVAPRRSRRLSATVNDEAGSGEEDAETRRLRARMEKAMDEGSGDSEDDDEDAASDAEALNDDDIEEDEGEDGSFHTESDGDEGSFHTEDEDEDVDVESDDGEAEEDGYESDDSETLKEGPLTAQDIKMRALMDKAMAAADERAGLVLPKSARGSSKAVQDASGKRKGKGKAVEAHASDLVEGSGAVDDDTMWDMTPGFGPKPLSPAMLAAAEAAEKEAKEKRQRQKDAAVERREAEDRAQRKKRRKVRKAEVTRHLENGRTLQLLPPQLEQSSALPPAIDPVRRDNSKNSKEKFLTVAMKYSGQQPGRGVVDGRKKIGMRTT